MAHRCRSGCVMQNYSPLTLMLTHAMQLLRISCLVVFGVSFFVSIATFKNIAGFKYASPIGLWIIYILWPLICTVIYVVLQLVLVFRTLEDRWPIGDILFGTAFFTIAQVILFAFSDTICDAIKHYIDGLFFFSLCMLLSVMMVYKYWDSITVRSLSWLGRSIRLTNALIARGSRVLRRLESLGVGSEGPPTRRRVGLHRGHRQWLSRPWKPRGRCLWRTTIPAGRQTWLPTARRAVLRQWVRQTSTDLFCMVDSLNHIHDYVMVCCIRTQAQT